MQVDAGTSFALWDRLIEAQLGGVMKRLLKVILILGVAAACTNPVEPRQKFMGDPPGRIDPAPTPSGFQVSHPAVAHP
jgi:hypothetical protein